MYPVISKKPTVCTGTQLLQKGSR